MPDEKAKRRDALSQSLTKIVDSLVERIHMNQYGPQPEPKEEWPTHPDVGPPKDPFVEYATIFKIEPNEAVEDYVYCVECLAMYPLADLLTGVVREDECPTCHTWAMDYYKNKPHRRVPHA